MTVRAKFKVDSINRQQISKAVEGKPGYTPVEVRTVRLSPVYSAEPNSENKQFWEATPSGSIELGCANLAAAAMFELGKEYYVDFKDARDSEYKPRVEDIAASAYRAYSASTGNKNFRGEPMPKFNDLPEAIRTAWYAAVSQAVDVARGGSFGLDIEQKWSGWKPEITKERDEQRYSPRLHNQGNRRLL